MSTPRVASLTMLLADLVAVSRRVAATRSRTEKIELLATTLRRLEPEEAPVALSYLAGRPTQQRLGAGHVTIYGVTSTPADTPGLELLEVSRMLDDLAAASGPGSKQRKEELLLDLYSRATQDEQDFLRGLMVRNLRQGALEGVMAEAVGSALGVPADRVRRAAMLEGDLVAVSARALAEGAGALGESVLVVFTPVQPMLAATADSAGEAVIELGEAVVEQKLDGLRLQVHRNGDDVKVFTRNLREIGDDVPDVIAAARSLGAESFILDGEGLLLGDGGRPSAFQESMSRPDSNDGWPLSPFFFDILSLDGSDLIDEPLEVRRQALHGLTPPGLRVGSIVTDDPGTAEGFFADSVAAGFEGVVVKDLDPALRGGSARVGVAQGEADPHPRSGHPRCRMGIGTATGLALQPPSRGAGRGGGHRHAGEDLQGPDRRDAPLADRGLPRHRDPPYRAHRLSGTEDRLRDRLRRGAAQHPLSRWRRSPIRASQGTPARQDG